MGWESTVGTLTSACPLSYVLRGAPLVGLLASPARCQPVVGLLASPASSHVSARPQPHSHERRCTVSTRLNFTHRHTSVHTTRSHSQHLFCEPAMGVWARPISLQASCSVACCWASRHNHARVARVVCCTEILIDLTSYGGVDYASSRS